MIVTLFDTDIILFSICYIYMCVIFIWDKHDLNCMRHSKAMQRRYAIFFLCLGLLITYIYYNGINFSTLHIFFYIITAILGYILAFVIHCIHCYTYYDRNEYFTIIQVISTVVFIGLIAILLTRIIL